MQIIKKSVEEMRNAAVAANANANNSIRTFYHFT